MIFDSWTIQLNHPTAGLHTASNTIADNLVFSSGKEDDNKFFRTILDQELRFIGDDYTYLKDIDDSADRCDETTITLTNGAFTRTYLLSLTGAEFNNSLKQVIVKPRIDDKNSCFLDSWDDDFTIFQTTNIDMLFYQGTIESNTVNFTDLADINVLPDPSVDPTDANWQILSLDAAFGIDSWLGIVVYVRQTVTTDCAAGVPVAPAGSGWSLRVDDCAGTNTSTYSKKTPLQPDPNVVFEDTAERKRYEYIVPGYDVDEDTVNSINGGHVLTTLMDQVYTARCGGNLVSDLLSINAPGTAPTNDVYDQKINVAAILIYQRSDIKNPDATEGASQGNISFKTILEGLYAHLGAIWWIDANDDLRIEHESILSDVSAFDFTSTHPTQIQGLNITESLQDDLPRLQKYAWDESYDDKDFEGENLIYQNACSDGEENYKAGWSTDVNSILANPDVASNAGFVLVAAVESGGEYYLPTETGLITGDELLNGHFAWANLHAVYHQHRRPFLSGFMNGSANTFTSAKRVNRQEVSVIISLTDYEAILNAIENPETDNLITTQVGAGEAEAAEYDVKNQTLTVTLLHD